MRVAEHHNNHVIQYISYCGPVCQCTPHPVVTLKVDLQAWEAWPLCSDWVVLEISACWMRSDILLDVITSLS